MCGRFTVTEGDPQRIAQRFDAEFSEQGAVPLPRFNVCPTETIAAVVAEERGRVVRAMRWDLHGAAARSGRAPLINVRDDTAAARPQFARLLASHARRALVVADGFYEWQTPERRGAPRTPMRFTLADGGLFALAGLWSHARLEGERVATCAIITTAPNALVAPLHDRMPVLLDGPAAEAAWLDPGVDADAARELLAPLPAAAMAAAPANPRVNKAGVEGPELLAPDDGDGGSGAQLRLG